jgi:tRNA(Ile)-lysidine synthase
VNRFVGEIEREMIERGLRPAGRPPKLLVAVSGGIDSVVLLDVLHRLAPRQGWKLVVAHFNHQLRGRASAADERFVRQLAARLDLPFRVGRSAVRARARKARISLEMSARVARHQFLAAAAAACGAQCIALGHHADDQVELFLWRLLRGAGSEGLGGMRWKSASPVQPKITLVRPLLGRTRPELDGYAKAWRLAFRHDATNDSRDMVRNRIRHELIPLLREKYQPGLSQVIRRQAELLRAEADYLEEEVRRWFRVGRPAFERLPAALQRRVLVAQLIDLGATPDFEKVEALRRAAGNPVHWAGNWTATRARDGTVAVAGRAGQGRKPRPRHDARRRGRSKTTMK